MEAYQGRRHGVFFRKKEEGRGEWNVRKVVNSCVWRCSWKGYGKKMKHGMELCVANNRGEASGLLVWLIISLKSTVGFVSKLN
jgi:hypothetical protein